MKNHTLNRLWVRFSLIFILFGLLLFLSSFTFNGLLRLQHTDPVFAQELRAIVAELSPEAIERIGDRFREEALRIFSTSLGAAVIISILVSIGLSRWLTRPLDALTTAAEAVERQDYSYRVPVSGSSEVIAVASAFNRMAAGLEEAESLRRNLLADVTHELRHPVHVLRGNLQAMLDDVYPMTKEEIARLHEQTGHLATLVNDLRELAQAEAHQLTMNLQATEIGPLVKKAALAFRPLAAEREVRLQVALQGEMPVINVDPGRIRQVIHNLVSNGIHHTPAGGQVSVVVERIGPRVTIQVADTGAGIDAGDLPRVFDRFYQVDSARRRDRAGTGLGLSISKALVEAQNGAIVVTSPGKGQGSTFTITLPLA